MPLTMATMVALALASAILDGDNNGADAGSCVCLLLLLLLLLHGRHGMMAGRERGKCCDGGAKFGRGTSRDNGYVGVMVGW
jgi:hypothetical protein